MCQTIRLCLEYNDNNNNHRSIQHSKSSEVPSNSSSVYGPNSIKQLSQRTGSPGQLKEKKNYTTHTRQHERQQHTRQRQEHGGSRWTPGSARSSTRLRRRCSLATSTDGSTSFSNDGVVEQLTATGASSQQPRRRHPVRQRRRRRTAVVDLKRRQRCSAWTSF